jgi:hypothetical protein
MRAVIGVVVNPENPQQIIVAARNTQGERNTMTMCISQLTFGTAWHQCLQGAYVQDAFPTLSAEEREFLISGTTPEAWAKMFPPEEEDV